MRVSALASVIALGLAGSAAAQSGWTPVGNGTIDPQADRTEIAARADQAYREMMLCVEGAPVRMTGASVRYDDGDTQDIRVRDLVRPDDCSRFLRLRGGDRMVAEVAVTYDPASLGGGRGRIRAYVR